MKTPFHTNIAQLKKELEHLRVRRTRTFTKIDILHAKGDFERTNMIQWRRAVVSLEEAIEALSLIKTK